MLGSLFAFYQKYYSVIFIFTIVLLVAFAWSQRFIQDDAFISFRYAQNFINGEGLVWNSNERVEGYTNFLWTILISGGIISGINPITCAYLLGLIFFTISIITTYKTSRLLFETKEMSFIVMLLLGLNYTFLSYATGGLETQMQTALLILGFYFTLKITIGSNFEHKYLFVTSILFALAILTRLDSGIVILLLTIFIGNKIFSLNFPARIKIRYSLFLTAPIMIIVGSWLLWKLSYYGNILPNTFYVKASAITSPLKGLKYVSTFIFSYLLFPISIISIFAVKSIFKNKISHIILLCSLIGLWLAYVIKIGGDFMEFRFFVPIMPFIFILFGWVIFYFIKNRIYQWVLTFLILSGSVHHALTFALDKDERIEPIHNLHNHLFAEDENWSGIGKSLHQYFNHVKNMTIGVTAAGAIPYFSELRSIDMYGLNDRYIAREGAVTGITPGHQRMSTFNYLVNRGVNLVIAHPKILKQCEDAGCYLPSLPSNPNDRITQTKVVEIPIDSIYKFLALYLTPHAEVDSIIEQNQWKVHLISQK